nr:HEXXH motif-containing putative peptide modification protein [Amycolatopsis balhimycina]
MTGRPRIAGAGSGGDLSAAQCVDRRCFQQCDRGLQRGARATRGETRARVSPHPARRRAAPRHLARDDSRERLYAPWREAPRPIDGVLHGIYAFFGVAAFWRALSAAEPAHELAAFEFALWRTAVWRTLRAVYDDESLTSTGRRFLDGIAAKLAPWQKEPVPT